MRPWELLLVSFFAAVLAGGTAAFGLVNKVTAVFIAATAVSTVATVAMLVAVIALGVQMGVKAAR